MKKNILVVSSTDDKNQLLVNLFEQLANQGFGFLLVSSKVAPIKQFQLKNWLAKKTSLGPALDSQFKTIIFLLVLPYWSIKFLARLLYYKYQKNLQIIICLNDREKIIFTPLAKLLKLKMIWLQLADNNLGQIKRPLLWLLRFYSHWSESATFSNFTKIQLINLGYKEKKIKVICPGISLSPYQENLFTKLAQLEQKNFHRKYFTVGTVANLNKKQKIQTLFQAAEICLNIIPFLQLIIIGEGEERKNLAWLAKKMGIDNLVWFVGEQNLVKKWLINFDLFVIATNQLQLDDYLHLLEAMAAGLPVIGPKNLGLEEIIEQNKTGCLIEIDNSEMLAGQIIKLQQNKTLRLQLGKNGSQRVEQFFTMEKMTSQFSKILT